MTTKNGQWNIIIKFLFSNLLFLLLCPILTNCQHDMSEPTIIKITGDLIIDNKSITYENQKVNVFGNVIVRNGGEMILNNSVLAIVGSYDEQYSLYVQGNSSFKSYHSKFLGEEYQTSMICEARSDASPMVYFESSYADNHLGIRPFDGTNIVVENSQLGEINVLDEASLTLIGGSENYIVLFFDDIDAALEGLHVGGGVSLEILTPRGWSFEAMDAGINGYQIDAKGTSEIQIKDSEGITMSLHTSGIMGDTPVTFENVTSKVVTDGAFVGIGPSITYTNTQIEYFNIYTYGSDKVEINGGVVNEVNTFESSSVSVKNCTLEYNLVQSFDQSYILIEDNQITDDMEFTPSVTSDDNSLIEIKTSDCQRLTANALSSSVIRFYKVDNLITSKLHKQDNGKVFVDNIQVK